MKLARKHLATAFTLVEVLLAMAVLGLIITAIYSSWMSVMRGSKAGLDAAAEAQRERIARQTVETALSSAILFQLNSRYYYFMADTTDEKFTMLSFVARLPESFPGSGLFPNEPVRRVTFAVESGVLTLRQSSVLLPTNTTEEPFRIVLASNVLAFGMEFWDTNLNDFVSEWTATNTLPKMMRASLGFGKQDSGGGGHLVASVVALPSEGVPANVQVPQGPQAGGMKTGGPFSGGFKPLPPGSAGVQFPPGGLQPGQGGVIIKRP